MKLRASALAGLAAAALALGACGAPATGTTAPTTETTAQTPPAQSEPTPAAPAAEESDPSMETIHIAAELKDCTGVGPMRCMQVAPSPEGPWTLFYGEIEGFTYEEGYSYELRVRTEPVANPPADGSSLRYILVEQVSKTAAGAADAGVAADELAGTSWALSQIDGAAPAGGGREASIEFNDEGRVAGSTGCNRFMGGYSAGAGTVSFGQLAGTMMACPDELMQQETNVLAILGAATGYSIADGTLTITADDGRTLVFTKA